MILFQGFRFIFSSSKLKMTDSETMKERWALGKRILASLNPHDATRASSCFYDFILRSSIKFPA